MRTEAKFYKNSNTSSAVEFNTSETNLNAGLKNLSTISSSESSSSSPVIPKNSSYLSTSYNYNNNNNTNNNNETVSKSLHGHRQSSSYDTSLIDTSNNEVNELFHIFSFVYCLKKKNSIHIHTQTSFLKLIYLYIISLNQSPRF